MIKKVLSLLLVCILLIPYGLMQASADGDEILSSLVHIEARPDFAFRRDRTNSTSGEAAPISSDYYLSAFKVTNAQYQKFINATAHKTPSYWKNGSYPAGKGEHPVLNISYSDAISYCAWLSEQYPDWHFRLPTEAEWENAAMGSYYADTSAKYPDGASGPAYDAASGVLSASFNYNGVIAAKLFRDYGSEYVVNYIKGDYAGTSEALGQCISINAGGGVSNWANHGSAATKGYFLQTDLYAAVSADGGYTTPVGTYPANTLGLYDMAGNCWDLTASRIVAVNGLEAGVSCYAVRGGSWYATARSCTFYYRGEGRKDSPSATVGFRLAADYIGGQKTCEHTYDGWLQADAFCHQQSCKQCGDVKTEAHQWDSGTVTKPATCREPGLLTYTCMICAAVSTQSLGKTDDHQYTASWLRDAANHWQQCGICGERAEEEAHSIGEEAACTVCGYALPPEQSTAPAETTAPSGSSETTVSTEAVEPSETTASTEAAAPERDLPSFDLGWLLLVCCVLLAGTIVWITVKGRRVS